MSKKNIRFLEMPLKYNDSSKDKLGVVIYYCIIAYIVSLFFKESPVITNVLMALILVFAFINKPINKVLPSFQNNRINLFLISFFFIQAASLLYSTNLNAGFDVILRRLPLLILPLAFVFIDFERLTWLKILFFYVIATSIASLLGFANSVYMAIHNNDNGFLYNDNLSGLLLGKQAVSFAFYVSVAIITGIYLLLKYKHEFKNYRGIIQISIVWLLFILFMLASKTALIGMLVFLICIFFSYLIRNKKYFELVILTIGMVVGFVFLMHLSPKTINRFNGITEFDFTFENRNLENHFNAKYDSTKWNSTNTRMAIWQCAIEVCKSNLLMGTGIGDRDTMLMKMYNKNNFWYAATTNKNTHNQYIEIAVSIGLVGLVLFLFLFFVFPIQILIKRKQYLALYIFLLLALCLITENLFDRYQAEIIIAFILPVTVKLFDRPTNTC